MFTKSDKKKLKKLISRVIERAFKNLPTKEDFYRETNKVLRGIEKIEVIIRTRSNFNN